MNLNQLITLYICKFIWHSFRFILSTNTRSKLTSLLIYVRFNIRLYFSKFSSGFEGFSKIILSIRPRKWLYLSITHHIK